MHSRTRFSVASAFGRVSEILSGAGQPAAWPRVDVTTGDLFAWKRFLQSRPKGVELLQCGVRS
eukprot:11100509-Lingulodinium_polyedra.AAC.1